MRKIECYVPESHLQAVADALFQAGAGRIGSYERCCYILRGQGQFLPLEGSKPFTGVPGQLQRTVECKLELVCEDSLVEAAVAALRRSHPYEEPAFAVIRLEDL